MRLTHTHACEHTHISVTILSQKRDLHTLMTQRGMFGKLGLPDHEKKGSITVCSVAYYISA